MAKEFSRSIGKLITVLAVSLLPFGFTARAQSLQPVLPLPQSTKDLPLVAKGLHDPKFPRSGISTEPAALKEQIQQLESQLASAKKPGSLVKELFEAYVQLNYSYDLSTDQSDEQKTKISTDEINAARRRLISVASRYVKEEKNLVAKTRALYHALIYTYLSGNQAEAIEGLQSAKFREAHLQVRAHYLVALHALSSAQLEERNRGYAKMLEVMPKLPRINGIPAHLAIARHQAGISPSGRRVAPFQSIYRRYSAVAVSISKSLSARDKEQVLRFVVALWQTAEPREKAPFDLTVFADSEGIKAVIERAALHDWHNRKKQQAINKYQSLASAYQGHPVAERLDDQILNMQRSLYLESKNGLGYQKAIIAAQNKYSSSQELDDKDSGESKEKQTSGFASDLKDRHLGLATRELEVAISQTKDSARQARAVTIAKRYLQAEGSGTAKERVSILLARLYRQTRHDRKALGIYLDLALNGSAQKKRDYLELAVGTSRVIANWPTHAPWANPKSATSADHRELLTIMEKLADTYQGNGGAPWPLVAHIGLLQLGQGQAGEAFKLWHDKLEKDPVHSEAQLASGFMLTAYQRQKNWEKVEQLAKHCAKSHIRPQYRGRPVNLAALVNSALFYGGKALLAANKPKEAVGKFAEFNRRFPRDPKKAEAMYLQSVAHRGAGEHDDSLRMMLALVKDHPGSRFYRQGLLNGGSWAYPMANEESTIYFYQKFLNDFPNDPAAGDVSAILLDLYLGKSLYAYAGKIYQSWAANKSLSAERRKRAAKDLLHLEEKFGNSSRAMLASTLLIKMSPADDQMKGEALAYQVRFHVATSNLEQIRLLERQIARLSLSHGSVRDGLAHARLALAEAIEKSATEEIFNLELKDPLGRMNQQVAAFNKVKAAYQTVCEGGESGYCAPAMFKLARLAEKTLESLEDVDMAHTLSEKDVNDFNDRKAKLLMYLTSVSQKSDAQSVSIVEKGETSPLWTSEILWESSGDLNFDQIRGGEGVGYLQWQPRTTLAEGQRNDDE